MVDLNIELPEHFFDEEERCGYCVTHEVKELWAVELDLLNEFQRVCELYNLKYYACGGTLLGAIRHHGFIPWDNDLDVCMLRGDYEKLKKLGNSVFRKGYFLQSTYNDQNVRQHMQLRKDGTTYFIKSDYGKKHHRGVFIDIFVFDSIPDDAEEVIGFKKKLSECYRKIPKPVIMDKEGSFGIKIKNAYKQTKHGIKVLLYGKKNEAFNKFEIMAQTYDNAGTKHVADITFMCSMDKMNIYNKKNFSDQTFMPFESLKIACPVGYDENLTIQFGDYHQYTIGGSYHGDIYYDVNHSYETYDNLTQTEFEKLFE